MEKSKNSKGSDKEISELVVQELTRFTSLVQGHRKLLEAIGNL